MIKSARHTESSLKANFFRLFLTAIIFILLNVFFLTTSAQKKKTFSPVGSITTFEYTNSTPIMINNLSTASVYPSEITVAGVNPNSIVMIALELKGFAHTHPNDVDILLEGPTGARSIVMSDAGGFDDVSGLNLVFMQGSTAVSETGPLTSGTFEPANYQAAGDNFPPPGILTNEPADFSVFDGTDPNGVWKLYIVDNVEQDAGEITGGWSLSIAVAKSTATVTKTDDTNDGSCDADCSLREAIASSANEIIFDFNPNEFNAPQTITLGGTELVINKSVNIIEPEADTLTISGNNQSRVLNIGSNFNVSLDGITISNGSNIDGGGIFNTGGTITLRNSTVSNNSSTDRAGGIFNQEGTLILTNSTVSNNSANFHGGIYNQEGTAILENSTVSNNSATSAGGGIRNNFGTLTLTNSTVSNNSANTTGGGIYNFGGTVNARNTIIANNSATTSPDFERTLNSQGYNLIENTSGTDITGDTTGNQTGVEPKIAPLGNYGGPTQTHALLPGSPAIDKGSSSGSSTDQRGFVRPFDDASIANVDDGSDIGAFERHPGDFSVDRARFDLDGDGKTDIGIFRPGPGEWWYLRSSDGGNNAFQFGQTTDKIAPADFTGDGATDIAFFRPDAPAGGDNWFVLRSEDNSFFAFPFGIATDVPAPGDFDGDGTADPAVFRPSIGTWFILHSSDGSVTTTPFGLEEDIPVVGDYDGDGKDDIAVFRPFQGEWYLNRSTAGFIGYFFGAPGGNSIPVPADYTGDGTTDIAFFNPNASPGQNNWQILRSDDESFFAFPFGSSIDIPVPGDYDGDGTADPAVYRPSNQNWFLQQTTDGFEQVQFGIPNDVPIPSAYIP